MDEETLIQKFEEWNKEQDIWYWLLDSADAAKAAAQTAWIASAKRADKRAREECATRCEQRASSLRRGGSAEAVARQCAKDIRATIQDEPT